MTAKTSESLAQVLESVGLTAMAMKARRDGYHDYLSDDAFCSLTLANDLANARDAAPDPIVARQIEAIRQRHLNGDFDADTEEGDEWAASEDGQETFKKLIRGE